MEVRKIKKHELPLLLALYKHLHPYDENVSAEVLSSVWESINVNAALHYFAIEDNGDFLATCNLFIIPNLTRGARSIGLIENVVTHCQYRRQGLGKKVLSHAIQFAKDANCYKLMLLSNFTRADSHGFYKSLGFKDDKKLGFVLTF